MDIDSILPAFSSIANSVSAAGSRCAFTENDGGGLVFRFEMRIECEHTFTALVFGKLVPKLRKALKPYGYAVHADPTVEAGAITFGLWQSSFYGKLSDLLQGYQSEKDFLERSREILAKDGIGPRDLGEVIAMLQAVESSMNGAKERAVRPSVLGAEPS